MGADMTEAGGGSKTYDVAVVGCGLMGSAIARTLARSGYSAAVETMEAAKAAGLGELGFDAQAKVMVAGDDRQGR